MDLNRRILFESTIGFFVAGKMLQAGEVRSALLGSQQARHESHSFGEQRVYFEGSTVGLKSLVIGSVDLRPGQRPHPPHTHVDEEIMVISEGTGQIIMNGTASNVEPGTVMYVEPNYLHGVVNTGSTTLTFYYIKWIARSA